MKKKGIDVGPRQSPFCASRVCEDMPEGVYPPDGMIPLSRVFLVRSLLGLFVALGRGDVVTAEQPFCFCLSTPTRHE